MFSTESAALRGELRDIDIDIYICAMILPDPAPACLHHCRWSFALCKMDYIHVVSGKDVSRNVTHY